LTAQQDTQATRANQARAVSEFSRMTSNCARTIAAFKSAGMVLAALVTGTLLSACAGAPLTLADAEGGVTTAADMAHSRAQHAGKGDSEHGGKAYAKDMRNPEVALGYARQLRAMGEKQQALLVLQQAAALHPGHRGILSEMGRLALDLEQVELAQRLLAAADDPANADWRTISARGTVLAKQGKYREAIPLYERALALAPNEASILNNLALALTMEGNAERAEVLLKQALAQSNHAARVDQNLALVLSLQGKYEEAKLVAARQLPADAARANVEFMQHMVQLEPKPLAALAKGSPPPGGAEATGSKRAPAGEETAAPGAGWITRVAERKGGA
jgi:Flp pilus assembly protein TadD